MERKFIIAYSIAIAALALAVIAKISSPEDALEPEAKATKRSGTRLSAISPHKEADSSSNKLADDLRTTIHRLQIQLDSVRAALKSTPEEQGLIEVDAETLCAQTSFVFDSLPVYNIAQGDLPMILALTESEQAALTDLFNDFRMRLHPLERKSIEVLPMPSDADEAKPGDYTIRIPDRIEGRGELIDRFEEQLGELLAHGRDRVEWLTITASATKKTARSMPPWPRRSNGSGRSNDRICASGDSPTAARSTSLSLGQPRASPRCAS